MTSFLFALALLPIRALAEPPTPPAPSRPAGVTTNTDLVPADSDEYAAFVRRAESGATDIDFRAMRLAYLESAAFLRAGVASDQVRAQQKEMSAAMRAGDAGRVRDAARRIMSLVYIDLGAQKALRQSCKILQDEACAARYHDIEFGLLKSILATGDGKSCSTAWEVVTVDEEYFILGMLGFTLKSQEGPNGSEICDKMTGVGENGEPLVFFFDVRPVFRGYERSFVH